MRFTGTILALALLASPSLAEDAKPGDAPKKEEKKDEKKEAKKEKRLNPEYEDAPLADLLSWLEREAGFEYDLSKDAQKACKRGNEKIRVVGKEMTAHEILDAALAQLGLTYAEKTPGQIRILTKEEFAKDSVLEMYDVRELLADVKDFPGPDSEIVKDGTANAGRSESPGGHKFKEPDEDQKEKDRPKKPIEEPEKLKKLIRDGSGGDDAWGENTSMDLINGILYVKAPWQLQLKVRTLLRKFVQFK